MAYVNVKDWSVDQVTDWLKGLDSSVKNYAKFFLNNGVTGHQLLNLRADDLKHLGVNPVGHQELILEAVEYLRNFHYELDKENLQMLAMRLSCAANSLYKELLHFDDDSKVATQTMSDVHNIIKYVKPLVCWLDRPPFLNEQDYVNYKMLLLQLSTEVAIIANREMFSEKPVKRIRDICKTLVKNADSIIQEVSDPMILQPASLDLATIRKKEQDLGFFILPAYEPVHQVTYDMGICSPTHQSNKIAEGDEIVQINYQTVVGWQRKQVENLLQELPNEIVLTLKKRPQHTKVYGQIYMKPYRLPSKKRQNPFSRWNENLPSPGLLTIQDLPQIPPPKEEVKKVPKPEQEIELSSESDSDPPDSPLDVSSRLYPLKPRPVLQRRNTISGGSPILLRKTQNIEQYWKLWKNQASSTHSSSHILQVNNFEEDAMILRDKSVSYSLGLEITPRPTTVIGIAQKERRNPSFKDEFRDSVKSRKKVNFEDCKGTKESFKSRNKLEGFKNELEGLKSGKESNDAKEINELRSRKEVNESNKNEVGGSNRKGVSGSNGTEVSVSNSRELNRQEVSESNRREESESNTTKEANIQAKGTIASSYINERIEVNSTKQIGLKQTNLNNSNQTNVNNSKLKDVNSELMDVSNSIEQNNSIESNNSVEIINSKAQKKIDCNTKVGTETISLAIKNTGQFNYDSERNDNKNSQNETESKAINAEPGRFLTHNELTVPSNLEQIGEYSVSVSSLSSLSTGNECIDFIDEAEAITDRSKMKMNARESVEKEQGSCDPDSNFSNKTNGKIKGEYFDDSDNIETSIDGSKNSEKSIDANRNNEKSVDGTKNTEQSMDESKNSEKSKDGLNGSNSKLTEDVFAGVHISNIIKKFDSNVESEPANKPKILPRSQVLKPPEIPKKSDNKPAVPPRTIRGKLDKSHSTPAYDLISDNIDIKLEPLSKDKKEEVFKEEIFKYELGIPVVETIHPSIKSVLIEDKNIECISEYITINNEPKDVPPKPPPRVCTLENYKPRYPAENPKPILDLNVGYAVENKDADKQKSVERPIQRSMEKSMERSIEKSMERSLEKSMERSIDKSIERSTDKSIERSIDKSIERSIEKSFERSVENPVEKSAYFDKDGYLEPNYSDKLYSELDPVYSEQGFYVDTQIRYPEKNRVSHQDQFLNEQMKNNYSEIKNNYSEMKNNYSEMKNSYSDHTIYSQYFEPQNPSVYGDNRNYSNDPRKYSKPKLEHNPQATYGHYDNYDNIKPKFEPKSASTPVTKHFKSEFPEIEKTPETAKPESKVSPSNSVIRAMIYSSKSKSGKKKNSIIAKRRNVSVNDISPGEFQGFLFQRSKHKHKNNETQWRRRWFVLNSHSLYGFLSKESTRAVTLIYLSGFTATAAPEVKSRLNAFKVYHEGTAFYFAADDPELTSSWIENIAAATLHNDNSKPPDKRYSETEESDDESRSDDRKHDESKSGEKGSESIKKFGSLKMMSSKKSNQVPSGSTSLDRKSFFKPNFSKSSMPVPTAQFRSYRKYPSSNINFESVSTGNFTSHIPNFAPRLELATLSQAQNVSVPNLSMDSPKDIPRKSSMPKLSTSVSNPTHLSNSGHVNPGNVNSSHANNTHINPTLNNPTHLSNPSLYDTRSVKDRKSSIPLPKHYSSNSSLNDESNDSRPKLPDLPKIPEIEKLPRKSSAPLIKTISSSNPSICMNDFISPFPKPKTVDTSGFLTLQELMNRQAEERKLNPHIQAEMCNLNLIRPDVVYGEVPIRPREKDDKQKKRHSRTSSDCSQTKKESDASSCFGKRSSSLRKSQKESIDKTPKSNEDKNRSLPRTHKIQDSKNMDKHLSESTSSYSIRSVLSNRKGIQESESCRSLNNLEERSYEMIYCPQTVNDVQFAQNRSLDARMFDKKTNRIFRQHSLNSADKKRINEERAYLESLKLGDKLGEKSGSKTKLKSAMQYMPMAHPLMPDERGKFNPRLAFELNLDEKSSKQLTKFKNFFMKQGETKKEKSFLGSPKLHRAIFRKDNSNQDSDWLSGGGGSIVASNSFTAINTISDGRSDSSEVHHRPPPTDYPGLVYPPVFEPETYSLADPQSSLTILRKQGKPQDK